MDYPIDTQERLVYTSIMETKYIKISRDQKRDNVLRAEIARLKALPAQNASGEFARAELIAGFELRLSGYTVRRTFERAE